MTLLNTTEIVTLKLPKHYHTKNKKILYAFHYTIKSLAKHYQNITKTLPKNYQTLPNTNKTLPNTKKNYLTLSKITKHYQKLPNITKKLPITNYTTKNYLPHLYT